MERFGRYIPNQLRKHRKMAGLTLRQVAHELGLKNAGRISQWENGEAYPSIINLFKLSVLYRTLAESLYPDLRQEVREALEKKKDGYS